MKAITISLLTVALFAFAQANAGTHGQTIDWVCGSCNKFDTNGGKADAARFAANVLYSGRIDTSNANGQGLVRDQNGNSIGNYVGQTPHFKITDSSGNEAFVSVYISASSHFGAMYSNGGYLTFTVVVNGLVANVTLYVKDGVVLLYDGTTSPHQFNVNDPVDANASIWNLIFNYVSSYVSISSGGSTGRVIIEEIPHSNSIFFDAVPPTITFENCANCDINTNPT